jgi:hypothetical protein
MKLVAAFSFERRCLNWGRLTVDERIVLIRKGKSVGLGLEIDF